MIKEKQVRAQKQKRREHMWKRRGCMITLLGPVMLPTHTSVRAELAGVSAFPLMLKWSQSWWQVVLQKWAPCCVQSLVLLQNLLDTFYCWVEMLFCSLKPGWFTSHTTEVMMYDFQRLDHRKTMGLAWFATLWRHSYSKPDYLSVWHLKPWRTACLLLNIVSSVFSSKRTRVFYQPCE